MPTIIMLPQKNISIGTDSSGQRLDILLSHELNITRSQAQKLIDNGQIKINQGKPKKFGEKVKEGDRIQISSKTQRANTELSAGVVTSASKTAKNKITKLKIKIIAKTPEYIIVDKPSGLLTHPTQAEEKESLAAWLLKKFPELKNVGEDAVRPGIVHRLDKEASGLLVVARTQKMFEHLKNQFKNRSVIKEYFALAHGRIAKDWDEINFPIARSENSEKMAAVPKTVKGLLSDAGKEAITEFTVEKRFVNFTLLRVAIHTGRTHQIRAHLFAYNHPIVGDPLYFQKKQKRTWDEKCGRLFLHCAKLGFTDLKNEQIFFESSLPNNLKLFLDQLK